MRWHIEQPVQSLGLHLVPLRGQGGWMVSQPCPLNTSIRRGMKLIGINHQDPSSLTLVELQSRLLVKNITPKHPITLHFQSAPQTTTTRRLRWLGAPLTVQIKTPATRSIGIELIPLKQPKLGWMIARIHRDVQEEYKDLRRGMTLMYINSIDMRGIETNRQELIHQTKQRPLEMVFKPPPRSTQSFRLQSAAKKVVLNIPPSFKGSLGIELIRKKSSKGYMVARSNNVRVRRGMTLQSINSRSVNKRRFHTVQDIVTKIQTIRKNKHEASLQLVFLSAPVSARSLSPSTTDRHRRRGQRATVVRVMLCGDAEKGIGLHLQSRHRGGAILKQLTPRLIQVWNENNNNETNDESENDNNDESTSHPSTSSIPLRKGFTLLSVNGIDVSIMNLNDITRLLQQTSVSRIPFVTEWRPAPRHSRSLSPTSTLPPANNHVDVIRVVHRRQQDGTSVGIELVPSKDKRRVLVKSVHGWAFARTEVRRGMTLQSINGQDVQTMTDVTTSLRKKDEKRTTPNATPNDTNVYVFRSAPAAVLTERQRKTRRQHTTSAMFDTVFEADPTRETFGLVLVPTKKNSSERWLFSTFLDKDQKPQCTNIQLLRKGAVLIRVEEMGQQPVTHETGTSSSGVLLDMLRDRVTSRIKMTWRSSPQVSLAAELLRKEKLKVKEENDRRRGGGRHVYSLDMLTMARQRLKKKFNGVYEKEARVVVGRLLDRSLRSVVPKIYAREKRMRNWCAAETSSKALHDALQRRVELVQAAMKVEVKVKVELQGADTGAEVVLMSEEPSVPVKEKASSDRRVKRTPSKSKKKLLTQEKKKKKKNKKATPIESPLPAKEQQEEEEPVPPLKNRICVTLRQSEHDPKNGVYWIKSKDLLNGSAERRRKKLEREKKERITKKKLKERRQEEKRKQEEKSARKMKAKNKWTILGAATKALPTRKEKESRQRKRERRLLGVGGLPIIKTLFREEKLKIGRITAFQDEHFEREREEAERLIRKIFDQERENMIPVTGMKESGVSSSTSLFARATTPKRQRPKTATPTRKEATAISGSNRGNDNNNNNVDNDGNNKMGTEKYYRTTKGVPLFTGGKSPFLAGHKARPSSAPRQRSLSVAAPGAAAAIASPKSPSSSSSSTSPSSSPPPAMFNMTDSHRELIVRTALDTVPNEYRIRYKPQFMRMLWSRALNLLEDFFDEQTTRRKLKGFVTWQKEATIRTTRHRKRNATKLQCWWRTMLSLQEMHERRKLQHRRKIRHLMIQEMERQASIVIQSFYRAEKTRIWLGWKGRKQRRHEAIQQLILLQRRWRGAAAKLLSSSLLLLRQQRDYAIRKIQRWLRGVDGRKQFQLKKKLIHLEERARAAFERRIGYRNKHQMEGAATTLQHWWCEMMRKQRMRTRMRLIRNKAAFKLTRWFRGVLGRIKFFHALRGEQGIRFQKLKDASIQLQSIARMFLGRIRWHELNYVNMVYTRETKDRCELKKRSRSRLVTKMKGLPKMALHYALIFASPFQYRKRWRAAVIIQSYWRRVYHKHRAHKIKRFLIHQRRRRFIGYAILLQARYRGEHVRRRNQKKLEKNSSTSIQKVWRGYWSRRFPAYDRAARMIQAIWRGKAAFKDFKLQNKSGSDGPMMEARRRIMRRYHVAFHGPARVWLSRRRARSMLDQRRVHKESQKVGEYEWLRTKARRSLWLLRSSMRLALASGPSKIGGYNGGQGSGSGKTIGEKLFRAASSSSSLSLSKSKKKEKEKEKKTKERSAGGGLVMRLKRWKSFMEPIRSSYFREHRESDETRGSSSSSSTLLPSQESHQRNVMRVEMIFASNKSRGDGMTFDNFITALSDVFDWMTDDARRAGGWYWMPALRRVNHAWGGLLQPPEITNWSPAHDEETKHKFWYNEETEESVWVAPKGVLEYHRLLSIQQKEQIEEEERKEKEEKQDGRSGQAARGMLATVATRGKRQEKKKRKKIPMDTILDRAATVFHLILSSNKLPSHREHVRALKRCVEADALVVITRIQRRWRGRPNLLVMLLDAAYTAKVQAWIETEKKWGALTIQCAMRREWGRREGWRRMCKRIFKFQVIETDEVPPLYHKDAPPTMIGRVSHFWYDKGRNGKSQSKHWTIPPILTYLGDVPIIPIDQDTVNPLCTFCDEDPQWQGRPQGNNKESNNNLHEENNKENNEESTDHVPWWEQAELKKNTLQRRHVVTRRCTDCSEMYCGRCYDRCHRRGQQKHHQYIPMEKCERCNYLLATVECFGCAAHPLWREMYDVGRDDSTGRKFYHNAHIGPQRGGSTLWERPFGYGGSARMCEGCFHTSHPVEKVRILSSEQPESAADNFLAAQKRKDQKWTNNEGGEVIKHRTRKVHRYKSIVRTCDECGDVDGRPALWSCEDCGYFCTTCLNRTHSTGNRQYHHGEFKSCAVVCRVVVVVFFFLFTFFFLVQHTHL